jgi:hypothetical protein
MSIRLRRNSEQCVVGPTLPRMDLSNLMGEIRKNSQIQKTSLFKRGNFDKNSDNPMEKLIEHFWPLLIKIFTLCAFRKDFEPKSSSESKVVIKRFVYDSFDWYCNCSKSGGMIFCYSTTLWPSLVVNYCNSACRLCGGCALFPYHRSLPALRFRKLRDLLCRLVSKVGLGFVHWTPKSGWYSDSKINNLIPKL